MQKRVEMGRKFSEKGAVGGVLQERLRGAFRLGLFPDARAWAVR